MDCSCQDASTASHLQGERDGEEGEGTVLCLPQALLLQAAVVMVTHLHTYTISVQTQTYMPQVHVDSRSSNVHSHTHQTEKERERSKGGEINKGKRRVLYAPVMERVARKVPGRIHPLIHLLICHQAILPSA